MAKRLAGLDGASRQQLPREESAADGRQDEAEDVFLAPPREPWIGRLRYIVVPIIAVVAIVAAIYLLDDSRNSPDQGQLGASSAVSIAGRGGAQPGTAPRIGYPAPDFTLTNLDSKQTKLSDFRGKTVFLNFFASWCPPCRAEMPDIVATYQENVNSDVVVLAVDIEEEPEVVAAYAKSAGLTFPIVLDRSGYVTSLYRITAIPTSFFIDKEGVVRDMQIGALSKSLMAQRLSKAF